MKQHATLVTSLFSGALFAFGLALAGMTRPEKILSFLQVSRQWDPSLAFVMVGAIGVHALVWRVFRKREAPLLTAQWSLPTRQTLDVPLLAGAAIFGVGWGLYGLCPGPALASLGAGIPSAGAFVLAMAAGSFLAAKTDHFWSPAKQPTPALAPQRTNHH